jgi:hypothetical protein
MALRQDKPTGDIDPMVVSDGLTRADPLTGALARRARLGA